MRQPDALQAKRILAVQLVLALGLIIAALPFGRSVAFSVLIGAAVCVVANAFFAFWVFRRYRAQEPGSLVARFYGAEVIKLFLILALFTFAFTAKKGLSLPALLVAYFAVQVLPPVLASGCCGREADQRKT